MGQLKVVIISMHFYPKQSPRSFRTTELALELARGGHSVTVYAMLGNFNYKGFSKINNLNIKSIGHILTGLDHSDGKLRNNIIDKILRKLFGRLIEYPLIELAFKIPIKLKKESNVDLLITIAFPQSIHWGTALAKKLLPQNKFPRVWISDCGDPYMGDPMSKRKFFYFKYIEKWWGRNTDYITIPFYELINYYSEFITKVKIIPQGLNFDNIKLDNSFIRNPMPIFAFAGSIYPEKRDPNGFLEYLTSLDVDFKFIVFTKNPNDYYSFQLKLRGKLIIRPYIPREQLIYELSKMDFLVNFRNIDNYSRPSKIIDYLLAKRPIMEVSSNFPQQEKDVLNDFFERNYEKRLKDIDLEQFNIKNVAQNFINLYYENRK